MITIPSLNMREDEGSTQGMGPTELERDEKEFPSVAASRSHLSIPDLRQGQLLKQEERTRELLRTRIKLLESN